MKRILFAALAAAILSLPSVLGQWGPFMSGSPPAAAPANVTKDSADSFTLLDNNSGSSATGTHNQGALTNGYVEIRLAYQFPASDPVTDVKYKGASLHHYVTDSDSSQHHYAAIWGGFLGTASADASAAVEVDYTSTQIWAIHVTTTTYNGAAQSNTFAFTNGSNTSSPDPVTASFASVPTTHIVSGIISSSSSSMSSSQTVDSNIAFGFWSMSTETAGTGGSTALNWSMGGTGSNSAWAALDISP